MILQGKIIDYGITKTKAGLPQVTVRFSTKLPDGFDKDFTWNGSLKEGKAAEITQEALVTLGHKGSLKDLIKGFGSGVLNESLQYDLTVEEEEWEGKKRLKIQWINALGKAGKFASMVKADEVESLLSGLDLSAFDAELAAKRFEKESKSDDIPF